MSQPCEIMTKSFLPLFRTMIAKELITKHNLSQVSVAETLDITQAAISQYISQKRGISQLNAQFNIDFLEKEAKKIAESISKQEIDQEGIKLKTCEICTTIQNSNNLSTSKFQCKLNKQIQ